MRRKFTCVACGPMSVGMIRLFCFDHCSPEEVLGTYCAAFVLQTIEPPPPPVSATIFRVVFTMFPTDDVSLN